VRRLARLAAALALLAVAGAAEARSSRIYMALWRGPTEVEKAFAEYLREAGVSFELIVRDAGQDAKKIPAMTAEIKAMRPDLVYAWGTPMTLGLVGALGQVDPARHVTDIPVFFTMVASPVDARIVAELGASGRNVTGVTHTVPLEVQLNATRSYGSFDRLGVIYNPKEDNSVATARRLAELGRAEGFVLVERQLTDPAAMPALVAELKREGAGFLYIPADTLVGQHRQALTRAAIEAGLPTFAAAELSIRSADTLMGLVSRYDQVGRFTAHKARQILEGRPAGEIPVERLSRFSLIVRMPVARALRYYPPVGLLSLAEVIE
jgi:putative tryptophan/tyrosine transport system substrate-binding protein